MCNSRLQVDLVDDGEDEGGGDDDVKALLLLCRVYFVSTVLLVEKVMESDDDDMDNNDHDDNDDNDNGSDEDNFDTQAILLLCAAVSVSAELLVGYFHSANFLAIYIYSFIYFHWIFLHTWQIVKYHLDITLEGQLAALQAGFGRAYLRLLHPMGAQAVWPTQMTSTPPSGSPTLPLWPSHQAGDWQKLSSLRGC